MRKLAWWMTAFAAACLLGSPAVAQHYVPQASTKYPRVKYADSLISINDRCAVRKDHLNWGVRPVYVNHQPVGFCCTGCPPIFSKEPERYLKDFNVKLADPVQPGMTAVLDSSMRAYINQDIFFFATAAARKKFERHPLKYCGIVGDPVTAERFRPTESSPSVVYRGRQYYFRSDSTRIVFQTIPDIYWQRR